MKTGKTEMNLLKFKKYINKQQAKKFHIHSSNNERETPCFLYYSLTFETMRVNLGQNSISFENYTGEYQPYLKISGIKAVHLRTNSSGAYCVIDIISGVGDNVFSLRVLIDY